MMNRRTLAFTVLGLLGLVGCTAGGQQTVLQPTATLAPIISMTPRFTATPVASRTPLPTFTFTPSITPIPPTPTTSPTPTDVPPVLGIVASSQTVNVREGPNTSFGVITALTPGTRVEVIGASADGAWLNILMEDGSEGWMSSRLLFVEPSPTPPPSLTPTVDRTAIALGTAFPTTVLGGVPVSPTPPPAAATQEAVAAAPTAGTAVIDIDSFNATATALVGSITGDATANARATGASTPSGPVGGPTGGPVGGPTPTLGIGSGRQGSASSQEGVDVHAYCNDTSLGLPPPRNLAAGATIDVYWWWYARTEAQLQDHAANVIYEVEVDGNRLTNWRLYAAPIRQQNNNYYQYWYVPYGPLTAGEHTITFRVTWREAISDGYEQFGPGTSHPSQEGTCTFTVQ